MVFLLISCGETEEQKNKRVSDCIDRNLDSQVSMGEESCRRDPVFTKCGLEYANTASGLCASNMKSKTYNEQVESCKATVKSNAYSYEMQTDIIKMCQ